MAKGSAEKIKFKPIFVWLAILVLTGVVFLLMLLSGNYSLKDIAIAYQDSYYNLFVSGPIALNESVGYSHLWGKTAEFIGMYPFFGTGMDCLSIPQMHGDAITSVANSFDKCYNDYLYIAATRGIAALVVYLGLLVVSIKKAFGSLKHFFADSGDWFRAAVAVSVVGYAAAIFFGVSGIMVAPYFFIFLWSCQCQEAGKIIPTVCALDISHRAYYN